jgi:hypothetical protein
MGHFRRIESGFDPRPAHHFFLGSSPSVNFFPQMRREFYRGAAVTRRSDDFRSEVALGFLADGRVSQSTRVGVLSRGAMVEWAGTCG